VPLNGGSSEQEAASSNCFLLAASCFRSLDDYSMPRPPPSVRTLAIIRLALLAGVLLFGVVVWLVHRSGNAPPANASTVAALRPVGMAIWAGAVLAVLFIRFRLDALGRTRPGGLAVGDSAALRLLAWAAGEAAALFGGVLYFLSGDPRWYGYGITLMVASFILVPVRPRA
jgi:hypothetical protein